MKHLLIVLLIAFQLTSASCTQHRPVNSKVTDAYDYPVKPGTEEWISLDSYTETLAVCQIPEDILANISTAGLAETVSNYPFYGNILAFNTPQQGLEAVKSEFNGLQELFKRNDAAEELLDLYQKKLEITEIEKITTETEKGEYIFRLAFLEAILLQDDILTKMSKKQLKGLINTAMNKSLMHQESGVFSDYSTDFSTWLIGKALRQTGFSPFIKAVEQNENINEYLQSGFVLDNENHNIIMSCADEFLS